MRRSPPLAHATDFAHDQRPASLVQGPFRYYHYGADGFDDSGWGCGFRTVQTILSWLAPDAEVPSIADLQRILGHDTGSSSWIGVQECVQLLDELHDCRVQVQPLASGREAHVHLPRLQAHFAAGGGPLMIGGGADVYSKTVIGASDNGALLILDPHYVGHAVHAADAAALRSGGWATWKPLSEALLASSFYNLALPVPSATPAPPSQAAVPPPSRALGTTTFDTADFEVVEEGFSKS